MTNSNYRCRTCKNYFPRPEYRRVALGAVCSAECFNGTRNTFKTPTLESSRTAHPAGHDSSVVVEPRPPAAEPDVPPKVRANVHLRDGARCRYCGRRGGLQHHHIKYRSEGGPHTEDNLITLCPEHHALVHTDKKRWVPVLQAYVHAVTVEHRQTWLIQLDRQVNGDRQRTD